MKHKIIALMLVSFLVVTTSPVALMQTKDSGQTTSTSAAQDWQDLQDLKPGKEILVEYKPGLGEPIRAKFVSLAGTQLTLSLDGLNFVIEQSEIYRVYRSKGKWSRSTMAKIGAGIGMITGTFIGAYKGLEAERRPTHVNSEADTLPATVGFFVGTVAGAGLGALIGGKRKGKLLYEAR